MSRRAVVTAVVAVAFGIGVWLHVSGFNGPSYAPWQWLRRGGIVSIALWFFLAAAPALIAQSGAVRPRSLAVAMAAVSAVALQLASLARAGQPPLERLAMQVRDPVNISYFTAAQQVADLQQRRPELALAPHFDRLIGFFPMHARTKPLLPVLIYVTLLRTFGAVAPIAAGVFVAVMTAASIVAMFFAAREVSGAAAAVIASSLLALMPGVALFFPHFDVFYPIFTCGLIVTWLRALRGSAVSAGLFGLIVFAMTLMSYSLLVLGVFCGALAIFEMLRSRLPARVLTACGIAIGVVIACSIVLKLSTGYAAGATFLAALTQQNEILPRLHRPYPLTIPFDLLDFALGAAWAPAVAALLFVARRERSAATAVAIAGLLTPCVVALTGLLQAETARVWIFLMPFLALPAAMEMVRWRPAERLLVVSSMVFVTIALYANMHLMWARPTDGSFRRIPIASRR